jgi:RND family efflux transporter MFP subunit
MKPAAFLLLLSAAAALAGCDPQKTESHAAAPRPVLTAEVHYELRHPAEILPGIVAARTESELSFRVAGKLKARLVDAGALVHRGDVLATLDDTDFRLQLEQAEAELASAVAARDQAEAEERRVEALHRQGWAASTDFDKIEAAAEQARRSVARAERAVTLSQHALDYAQLKADADGIISLVAAEPGQVVAAGTPVLRLAETAEREAAVAAPEALVEAIRVGKAKVAFWALPSVTVAGRLRELSPSADPATRTFPARFTLLDAPDNVRLGMSLTVSLVGDDERIARAPIGAVFDKGQGPTVWVVDRDSGSIAAAPVAIAGYEAGDALISGGVADGAEIVALGVHKLDAGEKVRAVTNLAGL